jgi:hypothetical protein
MWHIKYAELNNIALREDRHMSKHKGGVTMRKINNFIVIVTAVMLFSFVAAPPADAFVAAATLAIIFAATMATAIVATETVKRSNDESASDHYSSEQMTQDNLQTSRNTGD